MGTPRPQPHPAITFHEDGQVCRLSDARVLQRADSDLWHERMTFMIDHRGRCTSQFLQPNPTTFAGDLRSFYLKDRETGEIVCLPGDASKRGLAGDDFQFEVTASDIRWRIRALGVELSLRVFLPPDELCEIWTIGIKNLDTKARQIDLYPYFPVGMLGLLDHVGSWDAKAQAMRHDYFPYYVQIPDYAGLSERKNLTWAIASEPVQSWETSDETFLGFGDAHQPDGVIADRLANGPVSYRPACIAFQFATTLEAGASFQTHLAIGPEHKSADVSAIRQRIFGDDADAAVEAMYQKTRDWHVPTKQPSWKLESGDVDFDAFVNVWLPRRCRIMGTTLRFNPSPQGRNAIQDAMGGAMVDHAQSRQWWPRIWAHQHADGWIPHGMPMLPGAEIMPITKIPHKDTNVWGPGALRFYLAETGDFSVLDEVVPFADDGSEASLYDHLCRGLDWLLRDRTERGLSRIGQGDWNDPLNMAGPEERGESTWLTQTLAHALLEWAEVAEHRGDTETAARYRSEAQACRDAVNTYAWDGDWYLRGYTDAGRAFGVKDDTEGRIYLNVQSWALISGTATDERREKLIASVEEHLLTPWGPALLAPAFSGMQTDIGKLTIKTPGASENASVYCHAAIFYAYSLLRIGEIDRGWSVLRSLLPGTDGLSMAQANQLPLYIPNYLRGPVIEPLGGTSSHSPNTGSAPWYLRTVVELVAGFRSELNGLRIEPHLPSDWKGLKTKRVWRGKQIELRIQRTDTNTITVRRGGEVLAGTFIAAEDVQDGDVFEVAVP